MRRRHLHVLAIASAFLGAVALLGPSDDAEATRHPADALATAGPVTLPLALPAATSKIRSRSEDAAQRQWQTVTVRRGDTLSDIFGRLSLSAGVLQQVMGASPQTKTLRHLLPGQTLLFDIDKGEFRALNYNIDRVKTLALRSDEQGGFTATLDEKSIETRVNHIQGTIDSSLYVAGQQTGLSDNLIMELVGIFGWDIDFALDIRRGDRFSLLYEEDYVGGEKIRDGAIIAAKFVNQGRLFQAVRFTDPRGNSSYYSPDGFSMRKAFLRSPVDFRRISSGFQRERYHPVLGKKRPHRGVDYAAATGTPIKASGDGKIAFRGVKGGYGRTIIIQHGGRYSTLYAHMSAFRRGLRVGSRVKQGQVIGYVGKSGLATGPHLHYEFRVDGVHRNPLTVRLPNAAPIRPDYKPAFQQQAQVLLTRLDLFNQQSTVALNTP